MPPEEQLGAKLGGCVSNFYLSPLLPFLIRTNLRPCEAAVTRHGLIPLIIPFLGIAHPLNDFPVLSLNFSPRESPHHVNHFFGSRRFKLFALR
jgi:hypothetical protein